MTRLEKAAAHAYAEYCHMVFASDRLWSDWKALPAYQRRAWICAIKTAIDMAGGAK